MPGPGPRSPSSSAPLTLHESGRRAGGYRWVESRLFEALGAWAVSAPEGGAKAVLAAHARQHAGHADLWHELLPAAGDMTPESLTGPADAGLVAFAAELASPVGSSTTVERLVGAYRVLLPRMVTAYTAHLELTSAVCDGPVIRALRLVLRDEVEGWAGGEALIQSMLVSEDQVRAAAQHQARLEWMITAAGGVSGPGAKSPGLVRPENGQP